AQGAQLRGKRQSARFYTVKKRFHSQAIACQQQPPFAAIPNGERKHATQVVEEPEVVLLVKMQNGFGVAVRPELMAPRQEIRAQIAIVIDFTVEGNPDGLVLVGDRLVAAGQVNDAQAPIPQAQRAVQVKALVVRPTMHHRVRSALERNRISRLARTEIEDATNAAHKGSD